LDLRINVLTSHHEGMLFRIKFTCFDPKTQEAYPYLCASSESIKVVAKAADVKRKRQKDLSTSSTTEEVVEIKEEEGQGKKVKRPPKKKARIAPNDDIMDSLERIEERQIQYHALLENMAKERAVTVAPLQQQSVNMVMLGGGNDNKISMLTPMTICGGGGVVQDNSGMDFEAAYNKLIELYSALPQEKKAEEVRKIMRNNSARKTDAYCEMISLFNAEGLQKEMRMDFMAGMNDGGSVCGGDCPHKRELLKIDELYNSLLTF